MFVTPGSRATRLRVTPTTGGSTVPATLGPFTPLQTIYANSSNTITGMSGTVWTDATSALSITPASTANTFSITVSSATAFQLATGSNNAPFTFLTNNAERFRVELHGAISAPNMGGIPMLATFDGGGTTTQFQTVDTSFNTGLGIARFSAGGGSGKIHFAHSRGTTSSNYAIVAAGDDLGLILFEGSDGFTLFQDAASIRSVVDAAPSSVSMPGRIQFETTPTGTITPVERMRIDQAGHVIITDSGGGIPGNTDRLQVYTATFGITGISHYAYGANQFFGRPRIDLAKSRGTTVSSNVLVLQNDILGTIRYFGADGATYITGVTIDAAVDGTASSGNMPGRLSFATTSSGTSANERMRIDGGGSVWLFATTPSTVLVPTGAAGCVNETVSLYNHQGLGGL